MAVFLVALQLRFCPPLRFWRTTVDRVPNTIRCRWKCYSRLLGVFLHGRSAAFSPSEKTILDGCRHFPPGALPERATVVLLRHLEWRETVKTVERDLSATMGFTNNPSMAIRTPSHKKLDNAVGIIKLTLVEFKKRALNVLMCNFV